MTELSSPVDVHCWMKCRWLRLPIAPVSTIEIGIVTSAMSESRGEIHTIIETIATTVMRLVSSWLRVCCSDCATLSMSLVTRLSTSPRGCLSKYGSGSRCSFASTSARRSKTTWLTAWTMTRPCSHDSTAATT